MVGSMTAGRRKVLVVTPVGAGVRREMDEMVPVERERAGVARVVRKGVAG